MRCDSRRSTRFARAAHRIDPVVLVRPAAVEIDCS